jgi:hypothetical protein
MHHPLYFARPSSDLVAKVADFIRETTKPKEGIIEIEGKLGVLMDRDDRLYLPIVTEAIVDCSCRFSSDMSLEQHAHYNKFLNSVVGPDVTYKHLKQTDVFYSHGSHKYRQTIQDGQVIQTLEKKRLGDVNIYNPGYALDYRISINLEKPCGNTKLTRTACKRSTSA